MVGDAALTVPPDTGKTEHEGELLEDESARNYMELIDDILQPSSRPSSPTLRSLSAMDSDSPTFKALEHAASIVSLSFLMFDAVRRENAGDVVKQRSKLECILKSFDEITSRG